MAHSSTNRLQQQVYATLGDYLRREPSTLHQDDSLRDDLGLDSLQTIELVYQVESRFDIQIPDEDFSQLQTIGNVVTYLSGRTDLTNHHDAPVNNSSKSKKPHTQSPTNSQPRSRSRA